MVLRSDELNWKLTRINSALDLTGAESDYWLNLWDYAHANLGVAEEQFDDIKREDLAALVEEGLPTVPVIPQPEALPPVTEAVLPEVPAVQQRTRWSRSRKLGTSQLYDLVREMRKMDFSHLEICERLYAQKSTLPGLVGLRDLRWRAAYISPQYGGSVRKWFSKVTSVTP
jgi:hypothetical protein